MIWSILQIIDEMALRNVTFGTTLSSLWPLPAAIMSADIHTSNYDQMEKKVEHRAAKEVLIELKAEWMLDL